MSRLLTLCLTVGSLLLGSTASLAAGPETVARADRSLWPEALDNTPAFDRASRAEILVFAQALASTSALDENALKDRFKLKSADTASVRKVRDRLVGQLLTNLKAASAACSKPDEPFCSSARNRDELFAASARLADSVPGRYQAWYANAQLFHSQYAGELVRLAALFPRTSSEIDRYSEQERDGSELPDRHFLLTFDDGPSRAGDTSDALLSTLDRLGIHGSFYMLGERLQDRLRQNDATRLQGLYAQQCVALHGWQHQSHARWDDWQNSVINTQKLAQETFPNQYRPWFRPPYGQRRADSGAFFTHQKLGVALWNIDSQDWNAHVSASDAAQRVFTLMLLWRHGVILFHDIHPKAVSAVPWLVEQNRHSGVVWEDCHGY